MIREIAEGDGFTIWDTKTHKTVDIVVGYDYYMGNERKFYRVDVGGRTKHSIIRTLTEARKLARQELRKAD